MLERCSQGRQDELAQREGRQQDTGEHRSVITEGGKRTKGGSKHRDNARGDETIKIKQEVNRQNIMTNSIPDSTPTPHPQGPTPGGPGP